MTARKPVSHFCSTPSKDFVPMSIRNLDAVFNPRSIALIGASQRPHSVGAVLARNLTQGRFAGALSFVNAKGGSIEGRAVFTSIDAISAAPDLAVIATPPETVPGLIAKLGARGTRAAVVITAGFGELGAEGLKLQQAVLDAAKPYLLRIVGPNCVGILSPHAGVNASFAHVAPKRGGLALLTQSGAMLTGILDWAYGRGIGFSHLVSLGGMADADTGDMLDYLAGDPKADAVLCYLESVSAARKFMSAARRVARVKPVIVIKAGRHNEGARAAASHTGALAGADDVFDAACRRAGLLRVQAIEDLFDAAATLAQTRALRGNRVAILTNGGGLGVLAVDRCIDEGLPVARLSADTMKTLDAALPRTWSHGNPVDIIGDAPPERYRAATAALMVDPGVDVLLALNCPVATADSADAAAAVADAAEAARRVHADGPNVFASWLGTATGTAAHDRLRAAGIPEYPTPESAVQAISHLWRYQVSQKLLMETPAVRAEHPYDRKTARQIVDTAMASGRIWLTEPEAKALLKAYGIPVVETQCVQTPEAAARAAAQSGFPVALKILSPDITHKTDVGGVALNLKSADDVRLAAEGMLQRVRAARPNARIEGFTVQPMAQRPGAQELICGILDDPVFGPAILFGQGGVAVEAVADKAIALPPLNPLLAADLISRTRVSRLLKGYRDRPAANLDAVVETLLALQEIAADCPEVAELDINPLWADQQGVLALDARVRLSKPRAPGTGRFAIKPYPHQLAGFVQASGGRVFNLRPIKPEDAAEIQAMIADTDPEDIRMRFFTALRALPEALVKRLTQIDYDREMAFVALDATGQGAGVVRLSCDPDFDRAEYAIIVRSDLKGHGLGRAMMERLLSYARERGVREVFGEVLAENKAMRALALRLGFSETFAPGEPGVIEVSLRLT
jgi:acetyltransferase